MRLPGRPAGNGSIEEGLNIEDIPKRLLTLRALAALLATLALIQGVGGLYRLADYRADRETALAATHWATAFGPPVWFTLLLVTLLGALSLMLSWRLPQSAPARWLALFCALLAGGYGVMVTAVSSPLFDGYLQAVVLLQRNGVDVALLRGTGHAVAALERLLWIAGWTFAGAVAIHFVRSVLGIAASPRPHIAAQAALIQLSFACVAMTLPRTAAITATVLSLAVAGLLLWRRAPPPARAGSSWLLASATLFTLYEGSGLARAVDALPIELALAALLLLAAAWRVAEARPGLLFTLPGLLALATALRIEAVPGALLVMNLWLAVCMIVLVTTIARNLRALDADGRRQALCFLSGWVLAATLAAAWQLLVWGGRLAGCTPAGESALCWLGRYQDWLLVAPLPILLLSFVTGLLHRGPIDAARLFRRTAVYGSMLLLSLFVLGAIETLLGDFLRRGLPGETPPLVAAGVMGVVFYPAKRACDRGVERFLARLLAWADGAS